MCKEFSGVSATGRDQFYKDLIKATKAFEIEWCSGNGKITSVSAVDIKNKDITLDGKFAYVGGVKQIPNDGFLAEDLLEAIKKVRNLVGTPTQSALYQAKRAINDDRLLDLGLRALLLDNSCFDGVGLCALHRFMFRNNCKAEDLVGKLIGDSAQEGLITEFMCDAEEEKIAAYCRKADMFK